MAVPRSVDAELIAIADEMTNRQLGKDIEVEKV